MDRGPRGNHERQVLQAGPVAGVVGRLGGAVDEQVGAGLAVRGPIGELVGGAQELLEAQRRHDPLVVALRLREVGDVDAEVSEHGLSLARTPAATGTVMRTATLERYAADAGFASVEVLPIDHARFRFYRLHA